MENATTKSITPSNLYSLFVYFTHLDYFGIKDCTPYLLENVVQYVYMRHLSIK